MKVRFYNRNFQDEIIGNFDNAIVERYSRGMIGGPLAATIKIPADANKWELLKLLRCPVELEGADGDIKWWGLVSRIVIPHGVNNIGLGLDNLFNSIFIQYDQGTTSKGLDVQSSSEYGTKEFFIDLSNATRTDAENYRNTFLASHKYAVAEVELSTGQNDAPVTVECIGWWSTLGWKYYSNTVDTQLDNATQIKNIIASCGQFIQGTIIENSAGITCTQKRDGRNNGLNYVIELLNAGSVNTRPMLAYVDRQRFVHVYERSVEGVDYVMRNDGRLETLLGKVVNDEDCINAAWVMPKGVPSTLGGGVAAMRPFFIDTAECVLQTNEA